MVRLWEGRRHIQLHAGGSSERESEQRRRRPHRGAQGMSPWKRPVSALSRQGVAGGKAALRAACVSTGL